MNEKEKKGIGRLFAVCAVSIAFALGLAGCNEQERPSYDKEAAVTIAPDGTGRTDTTPGAGTSETEALEQILEAMTLEEKVGQMFLVRCPEDAVEGITEYHVGGYVLFANDFEGETKGSLTQELKEYQEVSELPLLFAVDEEGGSVVRISKFSAFRDTSFLAPRELYEQGGLERIAEDTKEKAELLLSLGIHVNLAPVCDITQDRTAFMYERSFGGDAKETAEYVTTVVTAAKEAGLGSVLKHFPGYGNNADTHEGIVCDTRAYETYVKSDFKPFLAGIEAGAGAVMVSHNMVECMDAENPASLSFKVHRILREELSFDGVILTDELSMDAIEDFTGKEAAAVAAVLAGNDMLCCTDFEVQIPAVIAAVKDGSISEKQIDESVLRILRWKSELGLLY